MAEDFVARALASLKNRDFIAARNCIAAFAETHPLELQHYLIKGLSDLALEDWTAALATFSEATDAFPHQPQLWFNRGCAEENLGAFDDAADSYEHALDLNPVHVEALGNLANIYRRLGLFIKAEQAAHKAFELGAPKAPIFNALGLALARQGKAELAEKVFRDALQAEPGYPPALANLANSAIDRLDFDAAWPLYAAARAGSTDPQIRLEEGMARLLAGETSTGWPLYEARLERGSALRVRPSGPLWRGEPLTGKRLLLVAEQGLGDVIQFCRYGAPLKDQGCELIWLVPNPLTRLLAANLPGTVIEEGSALPPADYWLPLMSLPLLTRKLAFMDAPPAPYLDAPEHGPSLPAKKGKQRIGLVWAGSIAHERALERQIPFGALAPLLKDPNLQIFAPFLGPALEDAQGAPIARLDHLIGDLADTAKLMEQLDYLVTVDTASAHLAGSIGVPTYLLLSHCPDWRWGTSSTETPWYPSLYLVRQARPFEWDDTVQKLLEAIKNKKATDKRTHRAH